MRFEIEKTDKSSELHYAGLTHVIKDTENENDDNEICACYGEKTAKLIRDSLEFYTSNFNVEGKS